MRVVSNRGRAALLSWLVLALALVWAAAPAAALDEPLGPEFGTTRFKTTLLESDDGPDVDTYVARLVAGEMLSVSVNAKKKLAVEVTLRGPDGTDRTPALKVKRGAQAVSFKKFEIDESGTWSVTVRPVDEDGAGKYTVSFNVKPVKPTKGKKLFAGTNAPPALHEFQAVQGSRLSFTIKSKDAEAAVAVTESSQPDGSEIPGLVLLAAEQTKKGKVTIKDFVLTGGDGRYSILLAAAQPTAQYAITLKVTPPPRPKKKGKLAGDEPRLSSEGPQPRGAVDFHLRLMGAHFYETEDDLPQVYIGGLFAGVVAVADDGTYIDVQIPGAASGSAEVAVRNPDGQAHIRPDHIFIVPLPQLHDVANDAGASVRKTTRFGGDELRLLGSGLGDHLTVDFSGEPVTVVRIVDSNEMVIRMPARQPGDYAVGVTDEFGRTAQTPFVVRVPRPGYGDGDPGRVPEPDVVDDWSASCAAVGDLDGDGEHDTLALGSPLYSADYGFPAIGTRDEHTRLLGLNDASVLLDRTEFKMPRPFVAAFPFDTDDFNATAIALGDLDGLGGDELVIGGFADTFYDGSAEQTLHGTNAHAAGVRVFKNVAGRFTLDPTIQPVAYDQRDPIAAVDENGASHPLFDSPGVDLAGALAIAIGDIDGDDDADVVVARDEAGFRRVRLDLADIDFSQSPPYVSSAAAAAYTPSEYANYAYVAGTVVLENRLSDVGALRYTTPLSMPLSVGGSSTGFSGTDAPGLHARDVALVDIDGDGDLDMVTVWDDPTTVSVAGRKEALDRRHDGERAYSSAPPMVATRILLNDGTGRFTDVTDSWMPGGEGDEWWQAHGVRVVDAVGDGAPDLVLGLDASLDAFRENSLEALEALFDDTGSTPDDIALGGEVDAYKIDVGSAGRLVVRTRLDTLVDSVIEVYGPNSTTKLAGSDDDALGKASRVDVAVTAGEYIVKVRAFGAAQTGTYAVEAGFLSDAEFTPGHGAHALRVLENRGAGEGFVDVTTDVLPALASGAGDEDLRGGALGVDDLDGDGRADIAVASSGPVLGADGNRTSSLRVLFGQPDGTFVQSLDFVPPITVDTGEADDLQIVDTGEQPQPSILLVSKEAPEVSFGARRSRLFDWNR